MKSIDFNYPRNLRSKDYELTAAIIEGMKEEYQNQFGSNNFYVLLLPGFETGIVPFLEKKGISYIDCRKAIDDPWDPKIAFPIDGHPTGLANQILADTLTSALKQRSIPSP
jgi:hypothetical protein